MKNMIILISFIIYSSSLFAQYGNQNLTDYINTYEKAKTESESKIQEVINENRSVIDRLSSLDLKILALRKHIETLPVNDFLEIIDKRIKAYEEDLYKPREYSLNHDEEIVNDKNKSMNNVRFGIYENILVTHMAKLYGKSKAQLILSPLLLKVKIIKEESESISISNDDWIGLRILTAEIQDIIKGKNHFKVGETIKFYFVPFWLQKGNRFSNNESYFISLIPVVDNIDGKRRLALNVNELNDGIVNIQQDTVLDEENYFGLGRLTWFDFKTKISDSINLNTLRE